MLALYHLFSGTRPTRAGGHRRGDGRRRASRACRRRKRVVLVGNKISPGNPVTKPDGTVVRTLWGELAWQLGGKKAFERIRGRRREGDQPRRRAARAVQRVRAVPDPDRRVGGLRAPAPRPERPAAGGFETQFTFAQVLTESAKLAKNCLLVISLPASDTAGSPHTQADDVEVGGQRGREALDRLRNVVGPRRVLVAAGQRRGGLRDRPAAAVRAAGRAGAVQGPRRGGARLRRPLPDAAPGVPARVPRRRLREAHQGGLPDPPGDLRPALHRLVHAGEVPAHPRRAAPDGGGDPQPVGEGRPQPADPAGEHPDRRSARAVRADPLPLGQLGAGDREGRGRPARCRCGSTARCPNLGKFAACRRVARTIYLARRRRRPPRTAASKTGGSSSAA